MLCVGLYNNCAITAHSFRYFHMNGTPRFDSGADYDIMLQKMLAGLYDHLVSIGDIKKKGGTSSKSPLPANIPQPPVPQGHGAPVLLAKPNATPDEKPKSEMVGQRPEAAHDDEVDDIDYINASLEYKKRDVQDNSDSDGEDSEKSSLHAVPRGRPDDRSVAEVEEHEHKAAYFKTNAPKVLACIMFGCWAHG